MPLLSRCQFPSLLSLIVFGILGGGEAGAASISWTGNSSNAFDIAGNWSGTHTPPQSADSLVFGAAGAGTLNDNLTSAAFNIAGITFNAGAGAFVIGGNAFTLTGDVANNSTSLQTINSPFGVSAVRTFTTTAGGGNFSLGGNIDGSGGITKLGAGTLTLGGANTFTGATKVGVGTLTLANGASISGTASLIVGDTGTSGLGLTGGSFISTTGLARLGVGGFSGSMLVDGAGSALTVGDYLEVGYGDNGVINITGGGHVSAATTIALGVLAGTHGTVTVSGAGSQFSATSTLYVGYLGTGSLTVDSGGIVAAGGQVLLGAQASGAGTLNLNSNGTLRVGGTDGIAKGAGSATINISDGHIEVTGSDLTTSLPMTLTGTANVHTGALNATFSGVLGGTGGLRKLDAGRLTLTGNNTYSGVTTIDAGTLQIGNGGASGSITHDVANSGTLAINRSGLLDYSGVISGSGGLTIDGGTFRLSAAQTYTGPTQVNAGILALPSGANDGLSTSTMVTIAAGGTLDLSGRAQHLSGLSGAGTVYSFGGNGESLKLDVAGGQTSTFSGTLGGLYFNFSLVKDGDGTQVLSGTNTYTGGTTVSGGTLQIGNGSTGSITGNVTVMSNGTLAINSSIFNYNGVTSGSGGVTLAGGGFYPAAAQTYTGPTLINGFFMLPTGVDNGLSSSTVVTLTLSGTLDLSSRAQHIGGLEGVGQVYSSGSGGSLKLDVAAGQTHDFSGVLGFPGGDSFFASFPLTVAGSGTQILSGTNNYLGGTTIQSGATLQLGNGGAGGSIIGNVTNSGTLVIQRSNDVPFDGVISGSGGLTINGGAFRPSVAQTYTGATTINFGFLVLPATLDNGLSASTVVTLGAGGNLDLSGRLQRFAGLEGNGTVYSFIEDTSTLTLDVPSGQAHTFSGNIGHGFPEFALTKAGPGTQVLAAANDYTGATTINGGKLIVNGSIASNATVNNGGTLGGSGTVSGFVTIHNGGRISPGNGSPGTLSTDSETWNGGAGYVWELNNASDDEAAKGVTYDWLNIIGTLDLTAVTSGSPFTIHIVSLTADNFSGLTPGFIHDQTYQWTIASADGGISGFSANKFAFDTSGFEFPVGGFSPFAISQMGNDLVLTYTVIPEPPEWGMMLGAALLGMVFLRRRSFAISRLRQP